MGSKTLIKLSVLSLGLAALVGCPSTQKSGTWSGNPQPVASKAVGQPPPTFPTGQQAFQQQGQQAFPQQGINGQVQPATGVRTAAPNQLNSVAPPLNPTGVNPYQQTAPQSYNQPLGGSSVPSRPDPAFPNVGPAPSVPPIPPGMRN